jgi:hypothetical protein
MNVGMVSSSFQTGSMDFATQPEAFHCGIGKHAPEKRGISYPQD